MHRYLRTAAAVLASVVAVAIAARFDVRVPGSPVPQSLQTLAVVLSGAALGPLRAAGAMVLYLVVGAVGAPVFADGGAGLDALVGPTAGYLYGFVLGAVVVGAAAVWERRRWAGLEDCSRSLAWLAAGALQAGAVVAVASLVAHAVILGLGWVRLGAMLGGVVALTAGVLPFLAGAVAKSVVAGVLWGVVGVLRPPAR